MMLPKTKLIILTLCAVFIMGCGQEALQPTVTQVEDLIVVTELPNNNPTQTAYVFETSEPGTITIKGRLMVLNPLTMLPDPDDGIFLVPLEQDGTGAGTVPQFNPEDVPQADVDEIAGDFVFTNIKPGKYIVVVMSSGGSQIPARNYEDGSPAVFTFGEEAIDTLVDLTYLSFP